MIDDKFKQDKCILPWVSFAIAGGNVGKICTSTPDAFCVVDKYTDLDSIWCGYKYKDVRDAFLDDKQPVACRACYRMESYGLKSRRERFKRWVYDHFNISSDPKIEYLDINFSNVCNLFCVMCSSEFSSKWIKHDEKMIEAGYEFRDHTKPYLNVKRVPKEFIDQIKIRDLKVVEVKGGEPLCESRFEYFIERFLSEGGTAHILITSNLIELNKEILSKLKRLPIISLDLSIDGTDEVYKYIRGTPLSHVEENIEKIKDFDNLYSLRINVTTSPYNLWNSYNLIPWARHASSRLEINWCPITVYPVYLAPSLLPLNIRLNAVKKFNEFLSYYNPEDKMIKFLDDTLNYLSTDNPEGMDDETKEYRRKCLIKFTDNMNELRQMDIYKIVPELGELKCMI